MASGPALPFPIGDGIVFNFILPDPPPTVRELVEEKHRLLTEAVVAYSMAVDAARVLEPHIEHVHLKVVIADEHEVAADGPQQSADQAHDASPEGDVACGACGQVH